MPHDPDPGRPRATPRTAFDRLTVMVLLAVVVATALAVAWIGPAMAVERIIAGL